MEDLMLNIIKKILIASSLLCVPVLPMQRTVSTLAKNIVLKKGSSCVIKRHIGFLTFGNIPTVSSTFDINSPGNLTSNQSAHNINTHDNVWHQDRHGSHTTFYHNEHNDNNDNLILEEIKQSFFHESEHAIDIIHDQVDRFLGTIEKQSYHAVSEQKSILDFQLNTLIHELAQLSLKNFDLREIIQAKFPGQILTEKMQYLDQGKKVELCTDALHAQALKNKIEVAKISMQTCDEIIAKVDRETITFERKLEGKSLDVIEKEVLPELTGNKQNIKINIAQHDHALAHQEAKLEKINAQLQRFNEGSTLAKIKGVLWSECSQQFLIIDKNHASTHIKNTKAQLHHLYDQNKICDAQFARAQQKISELHAQQQEQSQHLVGDFSSHELTLSSDALAIAADNNVDVARLENLSTNAQTEIVGLINRTADLKTTINDAQYDSVFTSTVDLAKLSIEANHDNQTAKGSILIDLGNGLLDVAEAVAKGAYKGTHIFRHPGETLSGIAQSVSNLGTALHEGYKNPHHELSPEMQAKTFKEHAENIHNKIVAFEKFICDIPKTPPLVMIENVTAFAVECVTLGKLCKAVGAAGEFAIQETKAIIQTVGKEISITMELARAEEVLVTTAEGLQVAVNAKEAEIANVIGKDALNTAEQTLHSEMSSFDKAKNAVKSEGAGAGSSLNSEGLGGPHGTYKDAGYHHERSTGFKSPCPQNGQAALDKSIRIKEGSPHRIAVEGNKFVVLRQTSVGEFHGSLQEWKTLSDDAQQVLRKAGICNKQGKIIKLLT